MLIRWARYLDNFVDFSPQNQWALLQIAVATKSKANFENPLSVAAMLSTNKAALGIPRDVNQVVVPTTVYVPEPAPKRQKKKKKNKVLGRYIVTVADSQGRSILSGHRRQDGPETSRASPPKPWTRQTAELLCALRECDRHHAVTDAFITTDTKKVTMVDFSSAFSPTYHQRGSSKGSLTSFGAATPTKPPRRCVLTDNITATMKFVTGKE